MEHMELFGVLRNVPSNKILETANNLLSDVNLISAKEKPVYTFSGGMKRRLSVALCFVGDPRFCVLDEPTTGMVMNQQLAYEEIGCSCAKRYLGVDKKKTYRTSYDYDHTFNGRS